MSGAHAESDRPRAVENDARERILPKTNDPSALNGGSARHWYAPSEDESTPTPRMRSKLIAGIMIFGTLFLGVVLLAELM